MGKYDAVDGYRRIWNEGNLESLPELMTSDCVRRGATDTVGIEAIRQMILAFRQAFSDVEVIAHDVFGDGDRAASRWTLTATHSGEHRGVAATGKKITMSGIHVYRLQDGRIAEMWAGIIGPTALDLITG